MTPEERRQFRKQLQDICDLVDEMLEVLRLKEGLTVEAFSSTFALLRGVRLADKPLPPSCRAGHLGGGRQGIEDRFL